MVPCLCVEDQAKGFVLARQAVHHIPKPCSFPSFHLTFLLLYPAPFLSTSEALKWSQATYQSTC